MSALEEKVLDVLSRCSPTFDQLNAQLGAPPGDLEHALMNLHRSGDIKRALGRIRLASSPAPASTVAIATEVEDVPVSDKKTCRTCTATKATDQFPPKGKQCKKCLAQKAAARYAEKTGKKAAPKAKPAAAARTTKQITAAEQLAILETPDGGVRIGYLAKDGPLTTMPVSIDLSAEQLDELVAWRQRARA